MKPLFGNILKRLVCSFSIAMLVVGCGDSSSGPQDTSRNTLAEILHMLHVTHSDGPKGVWEAFCDDYLKVLDSKIAKKEKWAKDKANHIGTVAGISGPPKSKLEEEYLFAAEIIMILKDMKGDDALRFGILASGLVREQIPGGDAESIDYACQEAIMALAWAQYNKTLPASTVTLSEAINQLSKARVDYAMPGGGPKINTTSSRDPENRK